MFSKHICLLISLLNRYWISQTHSSLSSEPFSCIHTRSSLGLFKAMSAYQVSDSLQPYTVVIYATSEVKWTLHWLNDYPCLYLKDKIRDILFRNWIGESRLDRGARAKEQAESLTQKSDSMPNQQEWTQKSHSILAIVWDEPFRVKARRDELKRVRRY